MCQITFGLGQARFRVHNLIRKPENVFGTENSKNRPKIKSSPHLRSINESTVISTLPQSSWYKSEEPQTAYKYSLCAKKLVKNAI